MRLSGPTWRLPAAVAGLILLGFAATGGAWAGAVPIATASAPAPADFTVTGELTQGGWIRGTAPAGSVSVSFNDKPLRLAPDGTFLAAFDRDAAGAASLVAHLPDGRQVVRRLAVAPRAWKIEQVPVAPRPAAMPSAEFQRRRAGELQQIAAARGVETSAQGWRQAFIWPARGRLSGHFGSQRIYRGTPGSYHSGTDIAGGSGTPFVAPADGVVILAAHSPFTLEGNLLMIDHGMGLNSAFLHCSELLVRQGDVVRQGQVIGRVGATGRASGPHLHW